ncbi:MAG: TetR/AcrR family transcriptional regulator [Clostridium sp.]|nr:TetR/AcrR family transcriptional regulator [Clostridium sp.]
MEELFLEVRKAAMRHFESYAERVAGYAPAFKRTGMQMVLFGAREPKLYQLLFMQENRQASDFEDVLGTLGATAEKCIANLCSEYGLSREQAHAVFEPVWIYTFGIGTLHATRVCQFSEAQVERMLSMEFSAMLHLVKASDTMSKHAEKGAD